MKKLVGLIFVAAASFSTHHSFSQGIALNTTGAVADAHAMLDVSSTTKGMLPPRLSATQRTTLAALISTSQAGMIVADATSGALYSWSGTAWTDYVSSATAPLSINTSTNTVSINSGTATGDLITWNGTSWVNMQPAVQHFADTADNRQPYLAIGYYICISGIFPSLCDGDPWIGEIDLYGFDNVNLCGYHLCDGSLLPITGNTALFSMIGIQFGGNGTSNFALPDLRGRVPIGGGSGTGLTSYTVGQTGGSESVIVSH